MKKIVLALFLTLLFGAAARSASLYILYDPACMDRLEYVALNGNDKSEYVVYHVNTSPGVKVVLEVGAESTTPQDFPPAQVIRCNNAVFDEKLVNAINSNIERVFMVVKKGNDRYYISPITFAARYLRANDYLLYDSPKYRFQFDTQLGAVGENIAYKNPNTEVYFEGALENECSGTLLFLQKAEFAGNPHTNIELIPEVGIVEVRSGINAADAMRNVLRLEKVNGKNLSRYLKQLCQGIEEPESTVEAAQPAQATQEFLIAGQRVENTAARGETPAVQTLNTPAAASTVTEYHTVKKGETLYRLSKQYKVSVEQLRAWNNKGASNTIIVGEKLRVASPAAQAAQRTAPAEGQIQTLGGPLGYENASPAAPAAVQAQPGIVYSRGTGGEQNSNYHIVKPGETIASIAMRYGYTEQRFREFNKLGRNDVAMIGTALKASDCDCPPAQTSLSNTPNWPGADLNTGAPNNYSSPQPRITTRYYQPGFTQRQPSASTSQRTENSSGNPEERFYEDDLGGSRSSSGMEPEDLNTPYFLDRQNTYTPNPVPAPSVQRTSPIPSQGREYSQGGEFYSVTGNRIDNTGGSGGTASTGRTGTGLISGSISSQPSLRSGSAQEYGYYSDTRSTSKSGERRFYIVKEGDTLFRIARMHEMSVEQLRAINNLGPGEVIIPKQKIYLN